MPSPPHPLTGGEARRLRRPKTPLQYFDTLRGSDSKACQCAVLDTGLRSPARVEWGGYQSRLVHSCHTGAYPYPKRLCGMRAPLLREKLGDTSCNARFQARDSHAVVALERGTTAAELIPPPFRKEGLRYKMNLNH